MKNRFFKMSLALGALMFSCLIGTKGNTVTVEAERKHSWSSFTEVPSDWTLYKRSPQGNGSLISVENKELVIENTSTTVAGAQYYGSLYQLDTEAYTDFTFKMEFAIKSRQDTGRFVGLIWHTNTVQVNGSDYLNGFYMNYRVSGQTAPSTICANGLFKDDASVSGSKLEYNEYHTLKVTMEGDTICHYIDNVPLTSYDANTKYTSDYLGEDYPRSGGFGILVNRCAIKIKRVSITDKVESSSNVVDSNDHLMALFNNYNGSMSLNAPSTWATNSYEITGVDSTSSVGVKASAGRYKFGDDFLDFGQYDETAGYPVAKEMSLNNYKDKDEELYKVYEDVHESLTFMSNGEAKEYPYITALITNDYITDIKDIAVYWGNKSALIYGNTYLHIIYQIEGESNWKILNSDDGSSSYYTRTAYGGVGGIYQNEEGKDALLDYSWNNFAIFAGDKFGDTEANANGDFATNLKGKTAKIGIIMGSAYFGSNNLINLSALMVNRVNSIKALVDGVESELIDSNNEKSFGILSQMCGYKMLQSQANELDREEYYERLDEIYGESLESQNFPKPTTTVRLVEDEIAFEYDHQPHSPKFHFVYDDITNETVDVEWKFDYYQCDSLGINNSKDDPTEIAWYAYNFTITDTYFSLAEGQNSRIIFHIDDSVNAFLRDWNAMRENSENGICDFINSGIDMSNTELAKLINRYDAFEEGTDKDSIRNATDIGSGGGEVDDVTIGETIEWARIAMESMNKNAKNNNAELRNYVLSVDDSTTLIVLFTILGLFAVSAYYFLEKRKNA